LEGALGVRVLKEETTDELQDLLNKRNQARKEKNWAVADECRNKLSELGYKIIDNKDGTSTLVKKI
jgi:cysteinyl-tRNA synthetase